MTITINQINSGVYLMYNNEIFGVVDSQHVKPGKGAAFVRVKMKSVKTGAVLDRTFRTSDKLEDVHLDEMPLEFLYHSGDGYHFMNHSNYEETLLTDNDLGDAAQFLLDHLEVTGLTYQGRVLKVILPTFISAEITHTEPGIKGDSSRAGNKPARIATGATIQVPLFVNTGDWVKIDTRTGQYVERIQK